jgi:hypothetical protein
LVFSLLSLTTAPWTLPWGGERKRTMALPAVDFSMLQSNGVGLVYPLLDAFRASMWRRNSKLDDGSEELRYDSCGPVSAARGDNTDREVSLGRGSL